MQGIRKYLKRYLPKSLFGRALLILLLPILLLQAVVVSIFVQRHFDAITEQMASAVGRELNAAIARIEAADTMEEARAALNEMAPQFGFEMRLDEGSIVETRALRTFYDFTGGVIEETLKDVVHRPMALDLVSSLLEQIGAGGMQHNFDIHVLERPGRQ